MAINFAVIMIAVMYSLSIGLHFYPAFIRGQQMQTYAHSICRVAELSGRIGVETEKREKELNEEMNIDPEVEWSTSGKVQQNGEIRVMCSTTVEIGNFGGIASYKIRVSGKASGQSEVYWK